MNSPSVLTNKSFSNPEAILMSLNVAPNAVRQGKHSGMETVATVMVMADTAIVPLAKCFLQYAPIVARKLKYRSSHAEIDQCIAVIATVK
jgi:threonine/homoserine/homoserine lactone efflux protein